MDFLNELQGIVDYGNQIKDAADKLVHYTEELRQSYKECQDDGETPPEDLKAIVESSRCLVDILTQRVRDVASKEEEENDN